MAVDFSLLDNSVEELADLKKFTPIPAGSFVLGIDWEIKDINSIPAVILKMAVKETLELANQNEEAPEPGKTSNITFFLKDKEGGANEMGQGQLKEILKVLQPVFGGETIREMIENSKGGEITATLTVRKDKNDPEKAYNGIKAVAV